MPLYSKERIFEGVVLVMCSLPFSMCVIKLYDMRIVVQEVDMSLFWVFLALSIGQCPKLGNADRRCY